ncbi:MAG: hypothetical protein AAF363_01700 [Bacteroidota bacterium]
MKLPLSIILISSICLIFSNCNPDEKREIDIENISFKTTDASSLFFKNIRLPYYTVEENSETGLKIYRFKDELETRDDNYLGYAIVHAWKMDRAYLTIEQGGNLEGLETINLEYNLNDEVQTISYEQSNAAEQARFAAKVYNLLSKGGNFSLIQENEKSSLWDNSQRKEAIRILMYDFFNLTGNF